MEEENKEHEEKEIAEDSQINSVLMFGDEGREIEVPEAAQEVNPVLEKEVSLQVHSEGSPTLLMQFEAKEIGNNESSEIRQELETTEDGNCPVNLRSEGDIDEVLKQVSSPEDKISTRNESIDELINDGDENEQINEMRVHPDDQEMDIGEGENETQLLSFEGNPKIKSEGMEIQKTTEEGENKYELSMNNNKGTKMEDMEEGELEEGELEDEVDNNQDLDEESPSKEEEKAVKELRNGPKEDGGEPSSSEKYFEVKDQREKEERKRKRRDPEEDKKKRKKRKHHYSSEEEDASQKKKFTSGRDNPYDFDTLLKQEMYLVGSSANSESFSPDQDQYKGPPFHLPNPYRGHNDMDSFESGGSGEEWEEKPRRRCVKRKRRGSRSPSRKNEAICMFYLQGSCKRGGECPYSHEIAPTRKMELCKFYMMDCCAKKEKCLYMHKDFPCKYFHFGMKCKAGDLCKFSHDSLQEITRSILLKHIELAPKDILGDFPRVSKHNAQVILLITEAKRKGDPVDPELLEPVLDFEGKGFKYLDRAIKSARKKKDGGRKLEKDKEKDQEKTKNIKNKDDSRDIGKDKEKDKEREKNRERDKDRERTRDKGRHRFKGENSYFPHKQRDSFYRGDQHHNYPEEGRAREEYGPNDEPRGDMVGSGTHYMDPSTKWYSSDEEADANSGQSFNQNFVSSQERKDSSNETHSKGMSRDAAFHGSSFQVEPNLPDIDVLYLKNVLSAVQSHTNKSSNSREDQEARCQDQWNSRPCSNKDYLQGSQTPVIPYMDMAKDIKEVFYDSEDHKEQFNKDLDSFLRNARDRHPSEDGDSRGARDLRRNFPAEQQPDGAWNVKKKETSRDPRQALREEEQQSRGFSRVSRDENNPLESDRNKEYSHIRGEVRPGLMSPKSKADMDFRPTPGSRTSEIDSNYEDRLANSIYDFDLRHYEGSKPPLSPEDSGLNTMPFRVPVHSSAKEIDASLNPLCPVPYRMIKVDVSKPDFSRLKINRDDPKLLDDPRLRKMLCREPSEGSPLSPKRDVVLASPSIEGKVRPSERDPRKMAPRDPRVESKGVAKEELRGDPRITNRPRPDPRFDNRDPRFDPRDTIMEPEMRDPDPRVLGPVFVNGGMDCSNFPPFSQNMGLTNTMPGIDPRGRPGLLGPAPNQNLPQGIGANPFLIPPGIGGPSGPFISGDRGDMVGGSGSNFPPTQWGSGRVNFNDPRLNRDMDVGSFTPSSVS